MDRPPRPDSTSLGILWATRVTTLGLEFSLPALAGWWIDGRWRYGPLGVIAGASLGFAMGMIHLLNISRSGGDGGRG